jgi:hypothetical protein
VTKDAGGKTADVRLEGGSFGYLSAAGRISGTVANSSLSASYTRSDGYSRSKAGALNSDYSGFKVFYQGNSQLSTLNSQLSLNPYDLRYNTNRVVNNTDGSIVGYKYFNFDAKRLATKANLMFILSLIPEGIEGDIDIMQDRPWISQGGKKIGEIHLLADMKQESWKCAVGIDKAELVGLHAIFLVFKSDTKDKSLCTLENFYFTFDVK